MTRRQAPGSEAGARGVVWKRYLLPACGAAVAVVFVIFALLKIEQFLIHYPKFTLRSAGERRRASGGLEVDGIVHASGAKVRNVFAPDRGRSVYLLPLEDRRRSLLTIDWVKEASLSRIWPDRLRVQLVERKPVAFVQLETGGPSQVALMDEEGVILEPPARTRYALPVLTGISREQSVSARRQRVQRMLELLEELGGLADKVSEIDVTDLDNLRITQKVEDRAVVLILGSEKFRARLETFLKHYAEVRRRLPSATTLDLRLEDRITAVQEARDGQ